MKGNGVLEVLGIGIDLAVKTDFAGLRKLFLVDFLYKVFLNFDRAIFVLFVLFWARWQKWLSYNPSIMVRFVQLWARWEQRFSLRQNVLYLNFDPSDLV